METSYTADSDCFGFPSHESGGRSDPTHAEISPFSANSDSSHEAYLPFKATFLMAIGCNLQCRYCYVAPGPDCHLEFKYAKAAVNFLIENARVRNKDRIVIHFHGAGEPTLNWDNLVRIWDYASEETTKFHIRLLTHLTTNGVISPAQRKWIGKNIGRITISCDGFEDVHNALRPSRTLNSFREAFESLRSFIKNGKVVGIHTTVTGTNVTIMPEWVTYLGSLGVNYVDLEPVTITPRSSEMGLAEPNSKDFIRYFLESKMAAKASSISVRYSGIKPRTARQYYCGGYGTNFVLGPKGSISTCYEIFTDCVPKHESPFLIGHIDGDVPYIDHNRIKELREIALRRRQDCGRCFARHHCGGGCLLRRLEPLDKPSRQSHERKCTITRGILAKYLGEAARPQMLFRQNSLENGL